MLTYFLDVIVTAISYVVLGNLQNMHTIMNGDEKSSLKSEITIRKMLVTPPKRWVRANC